MTTKYSALPLLIIPIGRISKVDFSIYLRISGYNIR